MQSMSHQRRVANLLLLATVAASISDLLLDLQVAWSLASNLGSVLAPATVLASSLLFRAAMSVVVGGIVDRYAPRTTMLLGLIGSLLLLLAFLAFVPIILTNVLAAVVFVLANDFCQSIFRRSSLIMASRSLRTEVFIKFQARTGVAGRLVGTPVQGPACRPVKESHSGQPLYGILDRQRPTCSAEDSTVRTFYPA